MEIQNGSEVQRLTRERDFWQSLATRLAGQFNEHLSMQGADVCDEDRELIAEFDRVVTGTQIAELRKIYGQDYKWRPIQSWEYSE